MDFAPFMVVSPRRDGGGQLRDPCGIFYATDLAVSSDRGAMFVFVSSSVSLKGLLSRVRLEPARLDAPHVFDI